MSGSVTEMPTMISPAAIWGSQCAFCCLGAAVQQRLGQDLGARDQRARRRERGARELLGGQDHREVAHLGAAVLLRDREAEVAELGHPADERLGHELVVAVDALGRGRDLLLAELAHGRAHLLVQLVERPVVAPARLRRSGRPIARNTDSCPARRSSARSSARESALEPRVAEPEVVERRLERARSGCARARPPPPRRSTSAIPPRPAAVHGVDELRAARAWVAA